MRVKRTLNPAATPRRARNVVVESTAFPKLVYETRAALNKKIGDPVEVGDRVNISFRGGERPHFVYVDYFRPPHKPGSEGKVSVADTKRDMGSVQVSEYYVSVIGAKWINRTDRT